MKRGGSVTPFPDRNFISLSFFLLQITKTYLEKFLKESLNDAEIIYGGTLNANSRVYLKETPAEKNPLKESLEEFLDKYPVWRNPLRNS